MTNPNHHRLLPRESTFLVFAVVSLVAITAFLVFVAGAYTTACVFLVSVPAVLVGRALVRTFQARGHDAPVRRPPPTRPPPRRTALADGSSARRLSSAVTVDDISGPIELPRRRPQMTTEPYTTAELRFFTEGEQIDETAAK